MLLPRLLALYCLLTGALLSAQQITIDNSLPRLTVEGDTVDAHDGRLIQFGDTYYWYGTAYGTTNGFTTANHYVVYRSPDLQTWTYAGRLLPDQPEGVYYRPHVIHNATTGKYVLWYNWYPQLWDGQFGVATSDSPTGPFEIVNDDVEMARSAVGLGDFGLFIDDDSTAYISYNTIQNHQVSIERLSADYLSSTLENGGIIAEHSEAGSQFKRNGKYYLLTDYTCCFCNYGSGARVYVSDHPMEGYTLTTNINRYPGRPAPRLTDGQTRGTEYATLEVNDTLPRTVVLQFLRPRPLDRLTVELFTGNRPENCGDVNNPRVHPPIDTPTFDIAYWDYDHWEDLELTDVRRSNSALQQTLELQFGEINTHQIKLTPRPGSGVKYLYINEIDTGEGERAQAYVTGQGIRQAPVVPAQQAYVMALETTEGTKYIWIGDLWGSASDNVKGHDYPYWSAPLEFTEAGEILPMRWTDQWSVELQRSR